MVKPEFTQDGVDVQTFEEIFEELADGYKSIYGANINLDPDSPDGQRVGIEAQARLDLQSFGLALYNQLDPDFAVGQSLNKLVKFNALVRQPRTRSYVTMTINVTSGGTLDAGYTVEDTSNQRWITLEDESTVPGDNSIVMYSEEYGAVSASPGTITTTVTVNSDVNSVTNAAAATPGLDEETDEELRVRRNASLSAPSTSDIGAMFTALAALNNVVGVKIYENYTDSEVTYTLASGSTSDLDPHSIWVIMDGGVAADIAETMAKTKVAGTGLKGSEEETYQETITLANGNSIVFDHDMKWDNVASQTLSVRVTCTKKDPLVSFSTDAIKEAIAATTYEIGGTAQANLLYEAVYSTSDAFVATALEISDDAFATSTTGALEAGANGKWVTTVSDVTVTVP